MVNINLVEPTFGLDDFQRPKTLKDYDALARIVLTILFGKPGFYPSIPNLGMFIQQYSNKRLDEIDTDMMKVQLAYQCSLLCEQITNGDIDILKTVVDEKPALLIKIPHYISTSISNLVIGVQIDEKELVYNYKLVNPSSMK